MFILYILRKEADLCDTKFRIFLSAETEDSEMVSLTQHLTALQPQGKQF